MTIEIGQPIPAASFRVLTREGPSTLTTATIFDNKKIALFAVPGAFTPTCHANHLPGFVNHYETFKAKGVDDVVCIAVNDFFVMDAWAKATGAKDKLLMLSDPEAAFSRAMGLELDLTEIGLGVRSQRYALYTDNGIIKALIVETDSGKMKTSSAEQLLAVI